MEAFSVRMFSYLQNRMVHQPLGLLMNTTTSTFFVFFCFLKPKHLPLLLFFTLLVLNHPKQDEVVM